RIGATEVTLANFSHVPTRCKFIALMPQWDFLDFLAGHARQYPGFHLLMQAQAHTLSEKAGRITGVRASTPDGEVEIKAAVVGAADGRDSIIRTAADLPVESFGVIMDVLWLRLPRNDDDPADTFGQLDAGSMMVLINRGDYWQCAFLIPKGAFARIQ